MENDVIERIIKVNAKVLTDKNEEKILTLTKIPKKNNSSISINRDDLKSPRYKIDLHIECDSYAWMVQEIKRENLPNVLLVEKDDEELFVNGESVCVHKQLYPTDILDALDKCGIINFKKV